ncbi:MAG: hypothetical protein Q9180_005128 [Flavoplaca navasiana]
MTIPTPSPSQPIVDKTLLHLATPKQVRERMVQLAEEIEPASKKARHDAGSFSGGFTQYREKLRECHDQLAAKTLEIQELQWALSRLGNGNPEQDKKDLAFFQQHSFDTLSLLGKFASMATSLSVKQTHEVKRYTEGRSEFMGQDSKTGEELWLPQIKTAESKNRCISTVEELVENAGMMFGGKTPKGKPCFKRCPPDRVEPEPELEEDSEEENTFERIMEGVKEKVRPKPEEMEAEIKRLKAKVASKAKELTACRKFTGEAVKESKQWREALENVNLAKAHNFANNAEFQKALKKGESFQKALRASTEDANGRAHSVSDSGARRGRSAGSTPGGDDPLGASLDSTRNKTSLEEGGDQGE